MVIRAVILSNDPVNGIRLRIDVDQGGHRQSFANQTGLKAGEALAIYLDDVKLSLAFGNGWSVHEIVLQPADSPDLDSKDDPYQPCNYCGQCHSEQD